ncbi:DUF3068 domain-containing protein [Nocardioides islandensis]|uniref:DUF3068 domain-containing protein n=1 Tax=Nocardioides islandensis TaxID=433663 RepID=A0A930YEJ8_9ACTN|nr:DUF3068 domain-containing protein [Nocardioides islandensis]MBF4763887.1 DUF3068 domain-containing protein [Nocardioides islandensis]
MRKLGMVLAGLGGFLVMLAILAKFYAPGQLMKTPLDVDSTTNAAGQAAVGDGATEPVKGTQLTRADSAKSDGDVIVFVSSSCLIFDRDNAPSCVNADDPDQRLITAGVDNFATDRKTAMAVNDPKYLPPDATPRDGLQNKWPFDVEKKTYPYWDDNVNQVVDATYEGTEDVDGIEAYKFHAVVSDVPYEVTDGVKGTYSKDSTIWIEPVTGSFVKLSYHMEQTTNTGDNFITLDLAYTEDEVADSVKDAKSSRDKLNLVRNTVPLIGFIVGIPLLVIGLVLTGRGGKKKPATESAA